MNIDGYPEQLKTYAGRQERFRRVFGLCRCVRNLKISRLATRGRLCNSWSRLSVPSPNFFDVG